MLLSLLAVAGCSIVFGHSIGFKKGFLCGRIEKLESEKRDSVS